MSSIDSEIAKFKNIKFARSLKSAKKGEYVCSLYNGICCIDHCCKQYLFVCRVCYSRQTGIQVGNPIPYEQKEIFCIDREYQQYYIEKEINEMKVSFIKENIRHYDFAIIDQVYNLIKKA